MTLRLPKLLSHVTICDVVVENFSFSTALISLTCLSPLNIKAVQSVARGELLFKDGFAAFNIINLHSVSDEPRHFRRHNGEAGQFVNRVQRVGRLSLGHEFKYLSLGTLDIFV